MIDGFLRRSTELFAAEIPFLFARQPRNARPVLGSLPRLLPHPDRRTVLRIPPGAVFFVVMDGGRQPTATSNITGCPTSTATAPIRWPG
ncbi:MAG: hypothetical protein ACLUEV_04515 [Alistipes sp.]